MKKIIFRNKNLDSHKNCPSSNPFLSLIHTFLMCIFLTKKFKKYAKSKKEKNPASIPRGFLYDNLLKWSNINTCLLISSWKTRNSFFLAMERWKFINRHFSISWKTTSKIKTILSSLAKTTQFPALSEKEKGELTEKIN